MRDQWKPHHIRISNRQIEIFVSKTDGAPIRQVPLEGCSFKVVDGDDAKSNCVEITLPRRSFFATAETVSLGFGGPDDAKSWVNALTRTRDQGENNNTSSINGGSQGSRVVDSVRMSTDSLSLEKNSYRRQTLMPPSKVGFNRNSDPRAAHFPCPSSAQCSIRPTRATYASPPNPDISTYVFHVDGKPQCPRARASK